LIRFGQNQNPIPKTFDLLRLWCWWYFV